MAIGEVFLGAFVTVLLERLASRELLKFLRPLGIDVQLKKWRRTLLMIEAVLIDAENKQTTNRAVKEWLNDLEDLAYDLDDLVDKLNTEAVQRKLMETDEESTSQVQKLLSTFSNNFSDFISERGINSELQEINERLEDLAQQISMISLVRSSDKTEKRLQLTSVVEESEVHGREKDKEDLLKMLLEVESSDSPVSVIPIVGMGGVGKTTLAQLVYNDDSLKGEFDLMAWACVSDEFDAFRITKIILEKVFSGSCDYTDLNMLQVKLKESLSNKRFLVVLDDVWNEKYGDWDILRRPFLAGKPRSKIIVTTRHEKVAKIMSRIPAYHLNLLSDNDALSLLAQHSLGTKTFDVRPDLREIGKSVVRRCQNLPLAVKSLGGLLRTKTSPREWEGVLNSDIWTAEEKSEILPALKLSYYYLPPELKQCFAYCAIFSKDCEFEKSELVYLWMAEGFLKQSQEDRLMEELGNDYFDELLTRSFFQKSSADTSRFIMHDLINDLAMCVSGYKCLRLDDMLKDNLRRRISEKVRHLSFISRRYESYDRFSSVNSFQNLRTFLPLSYDNFGLYDLAQRVLLDVVSKLYCMRELSLSGYEIYELPSSIGDLRHLRYFNLSRTPLKWLPESVSTLCNLQVLILEGCSRLYKLPARMDKLINLRHLNIADTIQLREMPEGIARLTSLKTLSKLIVSKSSGQKINDLRDLSLLKGEISIKELQHVVNVQEAMDARLTNKSSLNKIGLIWSSTFDDSRNEILELDVLDALKPHENLSSLEIEFYGGAKFPSWIGDSSFSMLTTMNFYFCKKCSTLPKLGKLPLLKDLCFEGMDHVKAIGTEFYGNVCDGESLFPSLENLTFEDMSQWEEWHGLAPGAQCAIEIPKLRKFRIKRCPKLVSLPTFSFPSLRELSVKKCNEVVLNSMHNLTSLTQLKLVKIYGLTSVLEAFEQFLKLENIKIYDCEDLVTLWPSENIVQRLVNLRRVSVKMCPKLLSIQEIVVIGSIHIENCTSLESLPYNITSCRDLNIRNCPSLKMMTTLEDCSTSLEHLTIGSWVNLNLTNLMGSFHNYSSLTSLNIYGCDGLESFPQGGLPIPNLRRLYVSGCRNLRSIPDRMEQLLSLENLDLHDCPSLTESFHQRNIPQGGLPIPNLRRLIISGCRSLRSLPYRMEQLLFLESLRVHNCPSLIESFHDRNIPQGGLPIPNLRSLIISGCRSLRSLPYWMEQLLSLEVLDVDNCPSLTECFHKRNIPPNLISLSICNCGIKPLGELDLHKLNSLESFFLGSVYPELVSFSNDNDEHYLLPPSLKNLYLWNLPNLETLSKGFQNLTSLRCLILGDCPKLVALPIEDQRYNLQSLDVTDCPLLKKRCLRNEGDYWPIIADIPYVRVDNRSIYDPESCVAGGSCSSSLVDGGEEVLPEGDSKFDSSSTMARMADISEDADKCLVNDSGGVCTMPIPILEQAKPCILMSKISIQSKETNKRN
ncbi:putative disease resistance RPP13-like protein 1 [Abeliophyllum distichum]|uniref:Disease resistance RPP13-like protein 1 n=1 Tax=Abeliophyllum distichum TaxID=126358 RepID=A0ABD1RT68_9LAMI